MTKLAHIIPLAALLLACCGQPGRQPAGSLTGTGSSLSDSNLSTPDGQESDTLYNPRHATRFVVLRAPQGKILRVRDPWQGARSVEYSLLIADPGSTAPEGFRGTVVTAPLRKVVCMSASFVAFLAAIGEERTIVGISGTDYISTPSVRRMIERKAVADVGYDNAANYELILALKPDLVLAYGVNSENTAFTSKLNEMGIKVFYIGDYVENSPLGRAEWIVPFGYMTGREEKAVAIFDTIESRYDDARKLAAGLTSRPEVMLNAPWRDSWFVPGDRSYMVRLIDDAGGLYVCRGEDTESSRAISNESAFVYASKADVWLNPGSVTTMKELRALNPNFAGIPAVRSGRVFNNNLRSTPKGGSDFWESGTVNPHIVLRDMVSILHPGADSTHKLYYFRHIK